MIQNWKRNKRDSVSPTKVRNTATISKKFNMNDSSQNLSSQLNRQKSERESTTSLEKKTYSIFNTDLKKERNKEQGDQAKSTKKKVHSTVQEEDLSILTILENHFDISESLSPESMPTNQVRVHKNSASLQTSPEPSPKKRETYIIHNTTTTFKLSSNSQNHGGTHNHFNNSISPQIHSSSHHHHHTKSVLQTHQSEQKLTPIYPLPLNYTNNPSLISMLFPTKSTMPPGLGNPDEPTLLKSFVAI